MDLVDYPPISDLQKISELVSKISILVRLNNPNYAIYQIELLKVIYCSNDYSQYVQRISLNICNLFLRALYNSNPNWYNFCETMDGLIIPEVDKVKISYLITTLNTLANSENPREAITNINLCKEGLACYERSPLILHIGQIICDYYLNFYRNYPIWFYF